MNRIELNILVVVFAAGLVLIGSHSDAQEAGSPTRVRSTQTGYASNELSNARQVAIEDGLRRCVESVFVSVRSESRTEEFSLVKDVIVAEASGFIESRKILSENPDQNGLYVVRVEAVVSRGDIDQQSKAFEQLLARKGRPRVLIAGNSMGGPFTPSLAKRFENKLTRRGLQPVDAPLRSANLQRDIDEALRREGDINGLVTQARSLGADIIFALSTESFVEDFSEYGVAQFESETTGFVRVIRVDNARVLASEFVDVTRTGANERSVVRDGEWDALDEAGDLAIQWTAKSWLKEVGSGGQEIVLAVDGVEFERINALQRNLAGVQGINEVILDRFDPSGVSELRVVSSLRSNEILQVLVHLDQTLRVTGASANRIELEPR